MVKLLRLEMDQNSVKERSCGYSALQNGVVTNFREWLDKLTSQFEMKIPQIEISITKRMHYAVNN